MMTLDYAEWLAQHLIKRISPFVEHVEVAGSVRRKRDPVGDLELAAIPTSTLTSSPVMPHLSSTPCGNPSRRSVRSSRTATATSGSTSRRPIRTWTSSYAGPRPSGGPTLRSELALPAWGVTW